MAAVRTAPRTVLSFVSPWAILLSLVAALFSGGAGLAQQEARVKAPPEQTLRSLAMVTADFDEDGVADLAIGYATSKGGAIGLMRGNLDAIAPQTRASWLAAGRHELTAPFLQPSELIRLSAQPDMLIAADVNGDGHSDLVYAAKGSGVVQLLAGTGKGTFAPNPVSITVPGSVTALASYRPGAPFTGEALLVGYQTRQGAGLAVVSDGPAGLRISATYALPGAATAMAVANLDDDFTPDTAIVAGGQLLVLHGANAVNGHGRVETLPVYNAEAVTTGEFLFDRHGAIQLGVLTTDGDVLVLAHQGFDPRPFTPQEIASQRHLRPGSPTLAQMAGINSNEPWTVIETNSQAAPHSAGSDVPLLLRSRISGSGGDDLVVLNASQQQRVTIRHIVSAAHTGLPSRTRVEAGALASSDRLVAAVSVPVNADARPGLVTLRENSHKPEFTVPSSGNTFYVNTTADNSGTTTDADDGTRCSNGSGEACTLRDAVTFANTDAADNISAAKSDTIMLPAGAYQLTWQAGTLNGNGDALTHLEILGPVSIVGSGANNTVINANSHDTVFTINPGPFGSFNPSGNSYVFDTSISNLTIENGKNPDTDNYVSGGINWDAYGTGNLTLTNVNIENCTVVNGQGGGLWVTNSANGGTGKATVSGSTISGNTTPDQGGGIEVAYPPAQIVVTNTVITGNTANPSVNSGASSGFGGGGGIEVDQRPASSGTAQSTFTNVTISSNSALAQGGGILDYSGILLTGSVVQGNSVTSGQGGGVFISEISPESAPTIASTDILSNTATTGGGGILVNDDGGNELTISLSRIFGNTSTSGTAGLAVLSPTTATATDNWWGCNAGPSNASCNKADSGASTNPWAELSIGANTGTITLGGSIDLTVSLNTNSASQSIGPFSAVSGDGIAYNVTGVTDSPALTTGTFAGNGTDTPTLTPTSAGSGSVSATFDNQTVSLTFAVDEAPAITSASATTFTEFVSGSFTVTTTGYPAAAISETGALPTGVSFVDNGNGTATLSGPPTAGGTFPITITADNHVTTPPAIQSFTLNVIIPQVQLTIAANPAAGGTVTPTSGSLYNLGTVVPITATPNTGFTFMSWSSSPDAVASSTSASTSITMNAAETVTAQFSANLVVNTATDDYGNDSASNCTPQATPGTTSTADTCTLRDALDFANTAGAASITFDSTVFNASNTPAQNTIVLGGKELDLFGDITTIIGSTSGSGATLTNLVTISGNHQSSVFFVNQHSANFDYLDIIDGEDRSLYLSAGYGIGGGVYSYYGTVAINGCTVSGNADSAPSGYYAFGGGLLNFGGTMTVTNSTISGNTAADTGGGGSLGIGGGIFNYGGTLTVTNSTISGNTASAVGGDAAWGGGITNYGGTLSVFTSTLSGNTLSAQGNGMGGGIYNYGPLTLTGSTLSLNSSDNAGGGFYDATTSGSNPVSNTIVSGNTAPADPDYFAGVALVNGGGNQFTTGVALAPLGNYGGSMQTMPPFPGDPSVCGGLTTNAVGTTDQRGFGFDPHCQGSVDSGAVQTNYAMGFSLLPIDVIEGQAITPAPVVTLYESGMKAGNANGIPVTLSDTGATLSGTLTQNLSSGSASFPGVSFTTLGLYTQLQATVALNATLNLTATEGSTITSSPVPAVLVAPAPSTTLPGPAVTFSWNTVTGATGYSLWIGSTGVGSYNLYHSGQQTVTSLKAAGLPINGETIYVRLYTIYNGVSKSNDYTFTASQPATLTGPAPSSTLAGPNQTFTWTAATGPAVYPGGYVLGYSLWLGSGGPGTHDLYDSGETNATTLTAYGLPTNGGTIYARLNTIYNGLAVSIDYQFTAANLPPAALTSPTPGSVLPGAKVTFTWSAATGASGYSLWLGTTKGASDVYNSHLTTALSATATKLPTNAETIYARLYTNYNGKVWYTDYIYTAAP